MHMYKISLKCSTLNGHSSFTLSRFCREYEPGAEILMIIYDPFHFVESLFSLSKFVNLPLLNTFSTTTNWQALNFAVKVSCDG